MAERAAWDFVLREGGKLELTVVNPVGIFGPVLGPDYSSSISIIKSLLDGMPGCPKITFGLVDVRDVVDLHIRAMTDPAAKGERFIAVAGESMSMLQVAKVLRRRMGASGRKTPKVQLPNWLVRIAAKRNPALGQVVPQLGKRRDSSNEKAKRVLGWAPRSNEEVIVATDESLVKFGLLNAIPG